MIKIGDSYFLIAGLSLEPHLKKVEYIGGGHAFAPSSDEWTATIVLVPSEQVRINADGCDYPGEAESLTLVLKVPGKISRMLQSDCSLEFVNGIKLMPIT